MVQAYPESDFIRVWITIGLVLGLLGLTWGFNSVSEKVSLKSTSTTFMKVFSSIFFLILIAPSTVVIDKVEGTEANVRIPAGHPEGYLEAFAQIYSDAADVIQNKENKFLL